MLVAVLDTGLDLIYSSWGDFQTGVRRVHEAFSDDSFRSDLTDADLRYTYGSLSRFLQTTQLIATTGIDGNKITYGNNDLYKNRKVPFAADYADGDLNVYPAESDHGTHVSGTIAGYAETDEGEVIFSGVAPDAQILAMKVFPDSTDSGAGEGVILAALEDALLLGADVVNLSLGSDNGWAEDDTAANHAYERMNAAGLTFMVSAGNSGDSTYGNQYGNHTLTADPETSMMSAPAVYNTGLAVASIENTVNAQSVLFWYDAEGSENKAAFADPNTIAMKASLGTGSWNVIPVDGYGTYSDYYDAGFRGYYGYGEKGVSGVALVKRGGGISFADKINAATQFSWSYYDPGVAAVDAETGLITAVSEGYAYIRAYTDVQQSLETVCIVRVVPCVHSNTTTVTVDAGCTADGLTTVTCEDCGHVISETVIPGGHAWEGVVTEPTCTEPGFTTYTCQVCGEQKVAEETAALGHSFEHIHVAPGCGTAGYEQYICTVCGYSYADGFVAGLECPSADFEDVDVCQWYHEAVDYVVSQGLMNGMDEHHFAPALTTNRAQVVTVLYRLAGSPAVEGMLPFDDVAADDWFHDALLWAYQNGIAMGMTETTFAPGLEVNRAQLVTFLYRYAKPAGAADDTVLMRLDPLNQ